MVDALIRLSEGSVVEEHSHVPAWVFGVAIFVVLVLLLFLVTRFNPNR